MFRTLKPFEYFEPKTIEEATETLSKYGTKAKAYAAGVDLVPRMRKRQIHPKYMVNIQQIKGLDAIKENAEGLSIGALSSLRSIELSPLVKKNYMVLSEAIHSIASIQVKTQGTAVGNLCVATPASDVAPALFVLDAKFRVAAPSVEKTVPIENFYTGVGQTVLQTNEIITEILLPKLPAKTGGAFLKLVRTVADIAKVNAAATLTITDDTCKEVRIAVGSVAPTVFRAKKAEGMLKGQKLDQKLIEKAAETAAGEAKPITDLRSTAEYRKETTRVLVKRVLEKALERAKA
ncbi:MAG: xanthine dehydrogenase family protein subunit M [Chloroflexota bacterium]|nr:xanthine dehydrogenase family protein subunit M [Chloroflexota bacterium]